jgi:hypothetical protein
MDLKSVVQLGSIKIIFAQQSSAAEPGRDFASRWLPRANIMCATEGVPADDRQRRFRWVV